ncbi:bifunctional DNA-formamidopyrimidine glycosylase/DNA-(apurinic or apyrimidinic site) lyase [Temperatibacter marinus]|uniref:Formamidopyrimidine-DNA glycosylase n=1 Tax=Temperatibacter marinus TaxID=1456591 RepID=A0AA52EJU2_9PROT|nr:bifunctional DNA-formamidopyrimidine glycosylase/DNA-(apurinic or apyrimidinic site) lyase [Temperatibacter marinus]WND03799.1 bifunctional DNA-formamidopyrimidine glycosylase/DNA-(apurinic or apyrimidinic site) lyase [Temperatibacter marinus]
MPELPEVETVMRGIDPVLTGKRLVMAQKRRPTLRFPIPEDFEAALTGKRVIGMRRRSKYILMEMEGDLTVLIHLGMSGRIRLFKGQDSETYEAEKHDHILLKTEEGTLLAYNDPRRFGMWLFIDSNSVDEHDLIKNIGPEPLGNHFNADYLSSRFEGKKTPIKSALLDQRLIAGLGNIYVCEALWRTGIHPKRQAGKIAEKRLSKLVPAIRDILQDAIISGGSTLKDHAQVDGELGYFQHKFNAYGRENAPCLRDSCSGTIKRIIQSGRSTFYCDSCQK